EAVGAVAEAAEAEEGAGAARRPRDGRRGSLRIRVLARARRCARSHRPASPSSILRRRSGYRRCGGRRSRPSRRTRRPRSPPATRRRLPRRARRSPRSMRKVPEFLPLHDTYRQARASPEAPAGEPNRWLCLIVNPEVPARAGLQPAGQPQDQGGRLTSRPRRAVSPHQRDRQGGAGRGRAGDLGGHQEKRARRRLQERPSGVASEGRAGRGSSSDAPAAPAGGRRSACSRAAEEDAEPAKAVRGEP
ncbi:MAG: hypothetical protein AVDCRST_MAG67-3213, partial [uncultured Solirubrobacteraceae bacterium]